MRTRIKICGLTRAEDVALAARLGADALGFIFAPGRRQLTLARARGLTATMPPWINRVGVFGPGEMGEAGAIAEACRLDTLQLHGPFDAAFCEAQRGRFAIVQALGVGQDGLEALQARVGAIAPHVDGLLLDTARPGQLGGTGETFDWGLLARLVCPVPLMVAGGLTADNVGSLIRLARPWGIDVASGVESAPGVKDPERLAAFISAARGAE